MATLTPKTKKSDKTAWIIVSIVGVIGIGLGSIWGTYSYGHVEGDEFSPDTFTRREYSYYQIPIIRMQITGIDRTDNTGALESHLKTNGIVTVQNATKPAWHTIQASEGGSLLPPGDAAILYRYMGQANAPGGVLWIDWSMANANFAAVLWPAVAQLARDELYILIPDLMAQAAKSKSVTEFAEWTNKYIDAEYTRMGDLRKELGYDEEADAFYKRAKDFRVDPAAAKKAAPKAAAEESDADSTTDADQAS